MINKSIEAHAVDITILTSDPANARKHSKRNIEAIKASLQRFGQVKPIVTHKNATTVIAGNGTLEAAKQLGWKKIAVVRSGLEGSDATAYGIADNRTAELAEWDMDVLDKLTANLDDDLVEASGFLDGELDRLLAKDTDRGTADHEKGMSRSEEDYANDTIKTFIVYLSLDQHGELVKKLDEVIQEEDLLSHGEAILHLAGIQVDEDD
jgi:ParB-like chromosome segregation protein Spo0J